MPTYKFQYFDGRGRGEIIRYVFHAADKDFEDIRYDFPTWATIKECKYLILYPTDQSSYAFDKFRDFPYENQKQLKQSMELGVKV
jgi:hypothetical protein